MRLRLTTENSVYHIDDETKTWNRVATNGNKSEFPLRIEKGAFTEVTGLRPGSRMVLMCPPITEGADGRMIVSSPIQEVTIL